MLNLIVCLKQVADPEAPASTYKVQGDRVVQAGVPPVINPFDANALEAALRLKDRQPARISVLSLGSNLAKPVLRKVLAAGADELILLEDRLFDRLDSGPAACLLAAAIRKVGSFDLILTGRQAADTNGGTVGQAIAELLGIPSITLVRSLEIKEGLLRVEQVQPDGWDIVETRLPALVTVTNELGELRTIGMRELMAAQKKPITTWSSQDLSGAAPQTRRTRQLSLFIPERTVRCEFPGGTSPEEMGNALAALLRERKAL
jgi:electron transfer flavoprotein beta subunit